MSNSKRMYCTTTPQMAEAIERLLWSGLYGNNRSEVIQRLLGEAIENKIRSGLVRIQDLQEKPR